MWAALTISEQIAALERYEAQDSTPEDFEQFWDMRMEKAASVGGCSVDPVPFYSRTAVYERLAIPTAEDGVVRARYIRPMGEGTFPTILMFHDLGRGVRGWHHMTRFVALGYAVAALENRVTRGDWIRDPECLDLEGCYMDALVLTHQILALPHTDKDQIVTWGEGFGGGLAVVVAALMPGGAKCAALNPMPVDFRGACQGVEAAMLDSLDYLDPMNFAPQLKGAFLMGTGLLDKTAPPQGQYALYHRARCIKRHLAYPKYEHERINFFENELLKFLHE